jgi:hypothetical protein
MKTKPPNPNLSTEAGELHGAVTAVSATSISAAGVTCVVPASLTSTATAVHVGDRVSLECTVANGTTTLAKLGPAKVSTDHHGDQNWLRSIVKAWNHGHHSNR